MVTAQCFPTQPGDAMLSFSFPQGGDLYTDRQRAIQGANWVLRGFLTSILDYHKVNSARYLEGRDLIEAVGQQVRQDLTPKEFELFCLGLIDPKTGKCLTRLRPFNTQ